MQQRENQVNTPLELDGLLAAMARGDREALARLYASTRVAVYGLAISYLHRGCDAEDVTQDTFVRAWEAAGSYRSQGKPLAWLLTITKNLALMKLREQSRVVDLSQESWDAIAADNPAVTAEDREVLAAALAVLGPEERRIVLLHAAAGMKHRETAQLLNLPLATVLSKYRRGLAKLKAKLEGDAHD